jgi:type IX secretion system PorP/SprF family membrane protein
MKLLKPLLVLVSILTSSSLWAQQPAQYTMFMFNQYQYNNAYNGLDESLSATAVFRKQWVGIAGSPLNVNFNIHLPVEYINSGFGLGVEYDQIGAYQNIALRGSYSYILRLGEGKLSIGAAGRMLQKSLNGQDLLTPQGRYEAGIVDHRDPNVPIGREQGISFSVDFGAYYKHEKFEIGIAATNLTQPTIDLATDASVTYNRAYFLTATYNITLSDDFSLHPHLLLKTDFVKFQPEIAAIVKYRDTFFGGISFRGYDANSIDALAFLAGMQITPNIRLAYAYDLSIGSLQSYNSGSHEVVLNYNLNKKIGKEIPAKVIYNPRFL